LLSSKIIKNAKLVVYKGAPHGMYATLKYRLNEELLGFIRRHAPLRRGHPIIA
jgi:non-heme chloroperoxidase